MSSQSWTLPRLSQSSASIHGLLGSVRLTYAICAFLATCLHAAMRNMLGMIILKMVMPRPDDELDISPESARLNEINITSTGHCGSPRIVIHPLIQETQSGDLPWTRNQELAFPGVYYYGYVVSISLSGYLADRCSSKMLFIVSLILEAIAYILLPLMAHFSFETAVIDLVICGLLAGCGNPAMYKLFVTWAHPTERTALLSFAYSGILMGSMLVYPVASYLSNFGWELSFYVVGGVTLFFGIACCFLMYDTIEEHPRISDLEVDYLMQGRSHLGLQEQQVLRVPWKKLLTAPSAYAFVLTHMFHNYTFLIISLLMPRFMREAMELDLREVGFLSAAPYLGGIFSKAVCILGGSYVERRVGPDQNCMRKMLYGICSILTSSLIWIIILADCEDKILVLLMFAFLMASTDMGFSGYWPTLLYFAPSFAGLLSGLANGMAHLSGFLAPHLVAALVHTGSKKEWNTVLLTLIAFNTMAMLVFWFCSSTNLQPWDPRSEKKKTRSAPAKEILS
ncbi:sialin isoform X1 [Drosophila subpulchrella]|uniref:sialin isoform X1 n=1 Tax=Drosophila subpulchrella TaxID=1486046 RepID=UPI0018A13073|nr:sialin isoform X1 [Drosophila subpulchrella]